jgi:lipid-A-disaccharide synthase
VFQKESLNIGIVCGEHSGDRLGFGLIQEIKKNVDVNLYGVGGPKLESLGFKSEFDFSELNIMGLVEPIKKFHKLTKLRKNLIKLFIEKNIDFFIGIDSPDFNMGIHKSLKNHHSNKNIQVVSPSVWGWRQNRIKAIQANIDLTLCLFNFEDNYYKKVGHNSMHVGHPFADLYKEDYEEVINKYNLNKTKRLYQFYLEVENLRLKICFQLSLNLLKNIQKIIKIIFIYSQSQIMNCYLSSISHFKA